MGTREQVAMEINQMAYTEVEDTIRSLDGEPRITWYGNLTTFPVHEAAISLLPYVEWGERFFSPGLEAGDYVAGKRGYIEGQRVSIWLETYLPDFRYLREMIEHAIERQSPGFRESAAGSAAHLRTVRR